MTHELTPASRAGAGARLPGALSRRSLLVAGGAALACAALPTARPCGWHTMIRQHIAACVRHWMARGQFSNRPSGRVLRQSVQMT